MNRTDLQRWRRYFDARNLGLGVEAAARKANVAPSTAYRFERGDPTSGGLEAASILGIDTVAGVVVDKPLRTEAREALDDFARFRLRYMGRKSTPWQERAAYDVLRAVQSGDREFVVINCPPGSGKSTLFTHDIICWLIARDRSIRIQIGSRTERQARMYVGRIKRTLERDAPLRASADDVAEGIAFDAQATMSEDYGAFKPEGRSEMWRAEGLVVRQTDGVSLDDKEPTVSAWGMDSGFLGGRFDLVLWDDLVDSKNTKSAEGKEALRRWYSEEAETRLEPGGALILQGQRIAHDDLYRTALDSKNLDESPKYRHIKYVVHDDDRCHHAHDDTAPADEKAWPDGCLLDPHRLPWKFIQTVKRNNPRTYQVQYQQQDGDLVGGLVAPEWIRGEVDEDGWPSPGCLDAERRAGMVPPHLTDGRGWSFVTVDPSPTEYWVILWWVYDPESDNRYLVDMRRDRLSVPQVLSLDLETFEYSGVLENWRVRSNLEHAPIDTVVFEINAAQRWFLQNESVQAWMSATGVRIVPHTTTVNKADPKYGVGSLSDYFRQGKIRIPWGDPRTRQTMNELITEHTNYPEADTDDTVMADWFHTLAIRNHYTPKTGALYRRPVPAFVQHGGRAGVQRGLASATL